MRSNWVSLVGSHQGLTLQAWALVTPVGVIAAPLASFHSLTDPSEVFRWMLIGLLAQIPMGIFMVLGSYLTTRLPQPQILTIVLMLFAGGIRGLTIAVIGQAPDVVMRTCASAVTMAIWLTVIGAALAAHQRHRQEVEELLAILVARELQGRLLDADVTAAARASAADRVAETSDQIRAIVGGSTQDHAHTAALLQNAIETRLRPLSHDLWFRPRPLAPQAHGRRDLLGRILTTQIPVLPLLLPALLLLSWGSVVLHGQWRGALVGTGVALAYGLVLALPIRIPSRPESSALVRYVGIMLAPAVVGAATIAVLGLGQPFSPIAVALGLPLITVGVATVVTLGADRARTVADLHARIAEPDWDRHLGELVRRKVDAATATMLHNSVQPALTAAALQLQLAAALDDPQRARMALERATRAIDEAHSPRERVSPGYLRLQQTAEAWRGIADVQLRLTSVPLAVVEWDLLVDVAQESIANAVRHGRATQVWIDIEMGDQELSVTVTDNGVKHSDQRQPGIGTTWLASVAQSVLVRVEPDGQRVCRLVFPRATESVG